MKLHCCPHCQRPVQVCWCSALPQPAIANHWPVHILQHRQEQSHPLNSARIAVLGLGQCELHTVTDVPVETTLPAAVLAALASALLIYPGPHSCDVAQLDPAGVTTRPLLLLDASWRKSRRLLLSSPWLQSLPAISVDLQVPSRYRIRREPAANYCSSLEAVCAVLAQLERNQQKYQPLLATMDHMIDLQIAQMGVATFQRNY